MQSRYSNDSGSGLLEKIFYEFTTSFERSVREGRGVDCKSTVS